MEFFEEIKHEKCVRCNGTGIDERGNPKPTKAFWFAIGGFFIIIGISWLFDHFIEDGIGNVIVALYIGAVMILSQIKK